MVYKKFFPAKIYRWHVTPLKDFKEMLLGRRANEKDNMILVTGARGEGKSTFTGKVLFQFEEFDPYKSIVYSKEALFKLIKLKNGYIWADEGVISASKGNVMTRANKLLFEMATINRDNFNIVFLLMPFVEDFDSKILQYCSCWIHIDSRGLGVLMLPSNKGLFGKRNWDIDHMKKIFDEFIKESKGSTHIPYWIYDNFRGYLKFGKLTQQQDAIIKEIKALRKNENLDKEMKDEVVMQVKEVENYAKYSAKNLVMAILEGKIRTREQFNVNCQELKLDPEELIKKCDVILRHNKNPKTTKQIIKEIEKEDALIKF